MGIFDDLTSSLESAVGSIFGGSDAAAGSNLGGYSGGGSPFPVVNQIAQPAPVYQPTYMNTMAMAPALMAGSRALMARFPNLSTALIALSQQFGRKFSPDQAWRMLKTYGPSMVVGLLGQVAIQELMVWKSTHKTRRMNVANTKALRRSVRRLKGFDRLSHRVSSQLARVGGTRRRSASRRCGTCRKSPCSC